MASYYDTEITLTGTLPTQVYVIPVVDLLSNVRVYIASGASATPAFGASGQLHTVTGAYLRIRIQFIVADSLRNLLIYKIT